MISLLIVIGVIGITFVSCGGEGGNSIQVFLRSSNNIDARSVAGNVGSENIVEFHVMQLLVNMDNQPYAGWIIRSDNHPDYPSNHGWYDIASLNRTTVSMGDRHNGPHSVVFMMVNGIKINGNTVMENQWVDIVAGDLTTTYEFHHFQVTEQTKKLPGAFNGTDNLYSNVSQFLVVVDESKLHDNGTLKADWWECFSFIARP